jgi:hypothetical protein
VLQGRWAGKHLDCTALAERQRHLVDRQCAELTDEIAPGHDWGPVGSAPLGAFLNCRGDGCAGATIEARSRASG